MDVPETEYLIRWFIDDYSHAAVDGSWLVKNIKLISEGRERTDWVLKLNPWLLSERRSHPLVLQRSPDDAGPETFRVKLEISLTTVDGSILYSERCEHDFRKGETSDFKAFVDMDELYVGKNPDFLPQDTLEVRCRMWRGEESAQNVKQYTSRSVIGIEKISVLHKVKNFSAFKLDEKKVFQIPSRLKTGCIFSCTVFIDTENSIIVDANPSDFAHCLNRKQLFVVNVDGNTSKCGDVDYRFKDWNEKETEMCKFLTKDFILKNKTLYLPKDELTLLCDYTFYIGIEHSKIDEVEISKEICKGGYCIPHRKNDCKAAEVSALPIAPGNGKLENNSKKYPSFYPTGMDDFKALYKDQLLTDVQLKTATKSFPAHKTVLCARSSVFRSMLSHDMKEKNTDCIKVDDLEDETVHRFLLFLYSDSLEDLRWESALKLYYAADKYEVKSLKILCSSFMVDNLSTSNASQLLLLADKHSDTELKELVEDFILEYDKVVFISDEWKKLVEINSQLGMKTMLLKYSRDESGK